MYQQKDKTSKPSRNRTTAQSSTSQQSKKSVVRKSTDKQVHIYTRFVERMEQEKGKGTLTKKKRQELTKKRGLTEKTIKKSRLLFGSFPIAYRVIQELAIEFTAQDLIDVGLAHFPKGKGRTGNKEGGVEPTKFISDDQIIIPYLSENSTEVIYLRSHKYGAKGIPLEVFGLPSLANKPETVVLTEGEYKALALQQLGIPSVAVGGISSFGGEKHIQKLVFHLMQANVKEVIVLFDNEAKNIPEYPNYKDDPFKRWDTDFWAIKMAQLIYTQSKHNIKTKVARFPDSWRVDGKVDPDSALVHGKTKKDFMEVVNAAVLPMFYLSKFLQGAEYLEARKVISWKLKKEEWKHRYPKEKNNQYLWEKTVGSGENKEVIQFDVSNFVLKPTHTLRRANGNKERFYMATKHNNVTCELMLPEKAISRNGEFRDCLTGKYELHWFGNSQAHASLVQMLDETKPPLVARETTTVGREGDLWIFGDGVIKPKTKKVLSVGKYGIVWDGLDGLLPLEEDKLPKMGIDNWNNEDPPRASDICEALASTYGSEGTGFALAWSLACVFSDELFEEVGFFPILGLLGAAKGTGKSSLARLILRQWGFTGRNGQIDLAGHGTTPKGLIRTLSKHSSIPIFADEYRNNLHKGIIGVLRTAFDRSQTTRANKSNDNKTNVSKIQACLILGGEELPEDPALRSRTIEVPIRNKGKVTSKQYKRVNKLMAEGQKLITWTLIHSAELKEEILHVVEQLKEQMYDWIDTNKGRRIAEAYALPLAVLWCIELKLEGQTSFSDKLLNWTRDELHTLQAERSEEDHLERFLQTLAVLAWTPSNQEDWVEYKGERFKERVINRRHIAVSKDKTSFVINLNDAFDVYEQHERRKGKTPFSKATIQNYLSATPYAEKTKSSVSFRFNGKRKGARGWRINLEHQACPESAKELVLRATEPFLKESF